MAISYVGGRTQAFAGTSSTVSVPLTSLTGGFDTAPSAGDFVVVFYGTGSAVTGRTLSVSSPPDWTPLTQLLGNDIYYTHFRGFYKRMGSTPDTSVTVSGTGNANDAGAVVVHVFRGVDETTPLDVAVVTANGASTSLANPPAITPVTSGAIIIASAATAHAQGAAPQFSSSQLFAFRSVGSNDTYDVTVGAGWTDWTSGAFDPAAFAWSGTDNTSHSWAAYTLALRPAPPDPKEIELEADPIEAGQPALGSPALAQTHSLTATGITTGVPALGSPTVAQTHSLTPAAIVTGAAILGAAALSQGHVLAAQGIVTGAPILGAPNLESAIQGAASLSASGTLSASGLRGTLGAGVLAAACLLSAEGAISAQGAASLTASSALDASAVVGSTFNGNAALEASGTLSSAGFATRAGGADLSCAGLMTANASREAVGAIDLVGSSAIIAGPALQSVGVSNLAAISALTAAGTRENLVEADLSGTSGITASATRQAIGAALLAGGGGTLTAGVTQRYGIAVLFASSEAGAAPSMSFVGAADLPAVGSSLAVVKVEVQGGASLAGIGTVQAEGALTMFAAVSLSASSSMVALAVGGSEPIGAWYKKPEDSTWVETTPFVFTSDRRATEDGAIRVAESGQERGTTSDSWRAVYRAFVRVGGQWRKFYGEE